MEKQYGCNRSELPFFSIRKELFVSFHHFFFLLPLQVTFSELKFASMSQTRMNESESNGSLTTAFCYAHSKMRGQQ